jgi:hypothetical protein
MVGEDTHVAGRGADVYLDDIGGGEDGLDVRCWHECGGTTRAENGLDGEGRGRV